MPFTFFGLYEERYFNKGIGENIMKYYLYKNSLKN